MISERITDGLNFTAPKKRTIGGMAYKIPINMDEDEFYNLIYEFVNLAKEKGLTVRQAQYLFLACNDYVLNSKVD